MTKLPVGHWKTGIPALGLGSAIVIGLAFTFYMYALGDDLPAFLTAVGITPPIVAAIAAFALSAHIVEALIALRVTIYAGFSPLPWTLLVFIFGYGSLGRLLHQAQKTAKQ